MATAAVAVAVTGECSNVRHTENRGGLQRAREKGPGESLMTSYKWYC